MSQHNASILALRYGSNDPASGCSVHQCGVTPTMTGVLSPFNDSSLSPTAEATCVGTFVMQVEPVHTTGELSHMQCSTDASKVCAALVEVFVSELAQRAAIAAADEGATAVEQSHMEQILPETLLDFR